MKIPHTNIFRRSARVLALTTTLMILVTACASTPPPTSQIAVAEAAVQRATTSNTSEHAPAELQIAIAKLASARDALARKEYDLARERAAEAELDAEVALVRAQAVSAVKAAQESEEAARVLREEINRKTFN
jgi:predicted component of type VI protein secretion system